MKKLVVFYLLIFAPLVIIIWMSKSASISSWVYVCLLLFYSLVYRTIIDGFRLYHKNVIKKKDIWKMIIPGSRIQYFKELYLK